MRFLKGILAIGLLALTPSVSSAAVFTPNPADLSDLDHYQAYTWKIDVGSIKSENVTAATLTFKNLYNWDANANALFIHLFNTMNAPSGGAWLNGANSVYQVQDNTTGTTINDFYGTPPSWLVGNVFLTQMAFPGPSQAPDTTSTNSPNPGYQMAYNANGAGTADDTWTYTDPTGAAASGGNSSGLQGGAAASAGGIWTASRNAVSGYDFSYTFSAAELTSLNTYIDDGWIALGFDSDCHFYNDGVSLNMTTSPLTIQAVPEPASLILLGSGLAGIRAFRKRRAARL